MRCTTGTGQIHLFVLDMRTYKDPNDDTATPTRGAACSAARSAHGSSASWPPRRRRGRCWRSTCRSGSSCPTGRRRWRASRRATAARRAGASSTFGPEAIFVAAPPAPNTSPADGFQFFGHVAIDGGSRELTVSLRDLDGRVLYSVTLDPERSG